MHDKNVMLCDDYFLNRGYQKYERTQFQKPDDMYMYNFQKRFDDKNSKKYFINVHKISNEWMPGREKNKEWYKPFYYEYSCQLYKKDTHAAVNMEFFSDWTIGQVEDFVERLFRNEELDYYERWNE